MEDKIRELKERIEKLRETDLSHETDFGLQNGFHEVNRVKDQTAEYFLKVLQEVEEVAQELPEGYLRSETRNLEQQIAKLEDFRKKIDEIVKLKTTDQNFTRKRSQIHSEAKDFEKNYANQLFPLEVNLRGVKAEKLLRELNLDQKIADIEQSKTKAETLVQTIRDSAAKGTYEQSQSSYNDLSKYHRIREWAWFFGVIVAAIFLIAACYHLIATEFSYDTSTEAIAEIFRKFLLLGAPLLFLRIFLTKYNAERYLHILYDHRNAAIDQLRLLEAAIDDDARAKADLRLEAARMILSDPQTSYGLKSEGSEVNISPILSAVERGSSKAGT